jgi:putative thiamine transport system ATP-binding protein
MTQAGLELEQVSLRVGGRVLLSSLTIHVAPGDLVTLMGPSGAGKSSLLAWLCGTLSPAFAASGRARIHGIDLLTLPPEERRLGILFQDDLLFPHLSVGQNLAFALPASVRSGRVRRERVEQALADAGLPGSGDRDPATLSGGQRARVAVMRALLSEPRALLLDEPFSKLDVALRGRFREFVLNHIRERRLPTLMVTHDPADAEAMGGRVVELGGG